jgi:hypothetical protein
MATMPDMAAGDGAPFDHLTREIAVQAELLALNFALEGEGAEEASAALIALSRELRLAGRAGRGSSENTRSGWRLEE